MIFFFIFETTAAYNLSVARCIEVNDLLKQHEYQRSRSLSDLLKRSHHFQTYFLFFSKKTVELFETKYHVKASGSIGTKFIQMGLVT